jgi:hypothetical protein
MIRCPAAQQAARLPERQEAVAVLYRHAGRAG